MHPTLRRYTTLGAALLTAGLLAACASHAPLPALEQARSTVERTTTNPAVGRYAQLELREARDALARADQAWNKDHDETETKHLAYLAERRAEIASNAARARELDVQVEPARAHLPHEGTVAQHDQGAGPTVQDPVDAGPQGRTGGDQLQVAAHIELGQGLLLGSTTV